MISTPLSKLLQPSQSAQELLGNTGQNQTPIVKSHFFRKRNEEITIPMYSVDAKISTANFSIDCACSQHAPAHGTRRTFTQNPN